MKYGSFKYGAQKYGAFQTLTSKVNTSTIINKSNAFFNLLGQICLKMSIVWYFISFLGIILDDFLRWILFGEEKPRYKLY